jgi:hypothetical protein
MADRAGRIDDTRVLRGAAANGIQRRNHMRKFVAIVALTLPALTLAANYKYHDVKAEFVSADAKNHIFTIKFDDGSTSTGPAEGDALKALPTLKPGDKVSVTCKDDAKGDHLSATAIKVLK